ncbi:RagB/SusD family nutrient uptake outer membrane protein [Sphingobacterium sp. LRF_L2]|uniref:RagB/SusD family nutrient uptake outer membrane protein n=1 Tax=Sphingobacterium sp. LRF_L2 TaxID=3369421 RepID=UPI003F5D7A76
MSPKSSVSESDIFSSEIGFQQALSGVYAQLATQSLYGDNLTMGFASALAQNYNPTTVAQNFYEVARYDYSSAKVIGYTTSVWNTAYANIAAVNNIIKHTETNRSVLSSDNYNIIRGEALALRALLHFDLLRLFGPSFEVGSNDLAIPYKTSIDQYSKLPSTVSNVIDSALNDLSLAGDLLKQSDPIVSNSLERQIKMNYYAVKALQARIYMYKGDKENAYSAAKEVIDSDKFSFVEGESINATFGYDYLLKSELVFGLRVREIADWADIYFKNYRGDTRVPNRSVAEYRSLYEVSDNADTDMRWTYLFGTPTGASNDIMVTTKYWQTWTASSDSSRLDQLVPMIRKTEMLYILAESSTNSDEALSWLNQVRRARNLPILTPSVITSAYLREQITKEYQKEFYAEGQLFYYYKRLNATSMQFLSDSFNTGNYVLPIPDNELEYNPNY